MKFDISDIVSISKPSESELKLHLNICICIGIQKKDIFNSRMILVILENHNSTWVFNSLFLSSNFRQNRSMKEDLRKLEFKAQLAHDGSVTKKISDFSNVKELYQRLAEVFEIKRNEVLSKIYIHTYIYFNLISLLKEEVYS